MNIQDIKNLEIEKLIDQINREKIQTKSLILKIKENLKNPEQKILLDKITLIEKRMNEPLELDLKFYYFLVPFGIVNAFISSEDINYLRFKKYRYSTKIKDYYFYSTLGFIFYIVIGYLLAKFL